MIWEELRYQSMVRDFRRYVEKGMNRVEIKKALRLHSLSLVNHLGYIMQIEVRKEEGRN